MMVEEEVSQTVSQPDPDVCEYTGRGHHWLILPPNGRTSDSICKYCPAEKPLFNSFGAAKIPADWVGLETTVRGSSVSDEQIVEAAQEVMSEGLKNGYGGPKREKIAERVGFTRNTLIKRIRGIKIRGEWPWDDDFARRPEINQDRLQALYMNALRHGPINQRGNPDLGAIAKTLGSDRDATYRMVRRLQQKGVLPPFRG